MPIQVIAPIRDQGLQQQLAISQIAAQLGSGLASYQQRQEQDAKREALAAVLGGQPGQGPKPLNPGAAGEQNALLAALGGQPEPQGPPTAPTPGLLPGVTPDMARSYVDAGLGPQMAQVGLQQLYPAPGEGFSLSPGQVRYNAGGQPIATAPAESPQPPNSVREAEALGYDLATPEGAAGYASWRQSLTRPPAGPTITLPAAETRMSQIDAERVAKEVPAELRALRAEHGQIVAMQGLLDQGVQTGNWEAIKQRARDLGINLPAGQGVEAFQSPAKQQLLSKIQQLPGPASDSDLRVIEQAAGSAGRSTGGNRDVLAVQTAIQDRQAQLLLLEERYYQDHNSLRGFEQFAIDWSKSNPLRLPQIAGAGQPPSPMDRAAGAVEQGLSGAEESFEAMVNRYAR